MIFSKKQFNALIFLFALSQLILAQSPIYYIPSDAPVVVSFNLDQLNQKVSLDELKQFDFYKGMLKEMRNGGDSDAEKDYMKKFMETPSELGYDMIKPFHFFMQKQGDITFYALLMEMGVRAKYESGLSGFKTDNYAPNLTDHGNYKFWSHADETFAWNDELIINIWAEKEYSYDAWSSTEPEGINWDDLEEETEEMPMEEEIVIEEFDTIPPPEILEEYPIEEEWNFETDNNWSAEEKKEALSAFAKKIMNKESLAYLTNNSQYKSAVSTSRSDVHFWVDYAYFLDAIKGGSNSFGMVGSEAAMIMQGMHGVMDVFYSDTYVSMGLNFQDGKMAIKSEMFVNKDMQRFYKSAMDAKLNKKLLRFVEGGDKLFGYYFFNLNIKNSIEEGKTLMHKMLQATPEYGQMADDAMKILGIFIDEEAVANLLKGDLLLAVSGMKMMEVTETTYDYDEDFNYTTKDTTVIKNLPIITMLASYGNEKDIMKFVDLGLHSKVIQREGQYFKMEIPDMGANIYMALKDGVMIFTNDQNLVKNKLETGYKGKQRLSKKHRKLMCENSSVFFWDIPNALYAISSETPSIDDPITGYLEMFAKQFESLEMTSSKKVENSVKSQFNFNFTNKGTNSLEQFFNFVNDIYIEFLGGARI